MKLFLPLVLLAQLAAPAGVKTAFDDGETLDYTLSWLRVTGGSARMTIGPHLEESSQYKITSVGKSNARFSRIFKVRDEIETVVARSNFSTVHYRKRLDERGKKKDETTVVNEGVATRTTATKTRKTEVPTPVYDPISMVYFLRTVDLTPGKAHAFQIIADGKLKVVTVQVRRNKDTITTEAGTFRCIVVEPMMHAVNSDARDTKLMIWYSDDERRLPVRMRSEVPVGTITASLKGVQPGVGSPEPPMLAGN